MQGLRQDLRSWKLLQCLSILLEDSPWFLFLSYGVVPEQVLVLQPLHPEYFLLALLLLLVLVLVLSFQSLLLYPYEGQMVDYNIYSLVYLVHEFLSLSVPLILFARIHISHTCLSHQRLELSCAVSHM